MYFPLDGSISKDLNLSPTQLLQNLAVLGLRPNHATNHGTFARTRLSWPDPGSHIRAWGT
jgi:hypothetical protein